MILSGCFSSDSPQIIVNRDYSLMGHGEMYADYEKNPRTIAILDTNVYYPIDGFQKGELSNFVFYSDENLSPLIAGRYSVNYSISFGGVENKTFGVVVGVNGSVNGGVKHECYLQRKLGSTGDVGNAGGTCFLNLNKDDNVGLFVESENVPPGNMSLIFANLNLVRIQ